MSDKTNYRWERIERLFQELRYEMERGMMDGEVDESVGFRFIVPISKQIPSVNRSLTAWCIASSGAGQYIVAQS